MEIEMDIDMESLGDLSNAFFWEVAEVLNEGLDVTNGRSLISIAGASHANEHWFAVRSVLENDLFSAAVFCHRAQRNALIRAIWHCFKADEAELRQFDPAFSLEDDRMVELMPPLDTMTTWVINHGLKDGEDDLSHMRHEVSAWFRESLKPRWQPLPKHDQDYPDEAMVGLQRDSNSLPSEIKSINIIFIRFPSD